jgi:hypothetical protein
MFPLMHQPAMDFHFYSTGQAGAGITAIQLVPYLHTRAEDHAPTKRTYRHEAAYGAFKAVEYMSFPAQVDFEAAISTFATHFTRRPGWLVPRDFFSLPAHITTHKCPHHNSTE